MFLRVFLVQTASASYQELLISHCLEAAIEVKFCVHESVTVLVSKFMQFQMI